VPGRIELDIDDTEDAVHGSQQLALFNAYYDSHCFLPIHIYEGASGKLVTTGADRGDPPERVAPARGSGERAGNRSKDRCATESPAASLA